MVWLTARLGIHPVLNAVERIKEDSPIPEVGANEFRYLARTYNKMYEVYKKSLAHLNFKASHDELTGAYNRSGYELLLSSIDLGSTYMMLFDVDNFKTINDTYGHEVGDKVLTKLVQILKKNFRSDDYVCRIGGDEFVVFMVHSSEVQHNLVASKIKAINRELNEAEDGLPPVTISVGITHGTDATDATDLFEKTGDGMKVEDGALFTNPWTNAHPAPMNMVAPSPATFGVSDHAPFAVRGIPYIYFEATNWWAKGLDDYSSYYGNIETYDAGIGDGGQFMNRDCDTLENLNELFPGRAEQHYRMYSPVLSALLLVK